MSALDERVAAAVPVSGYFAFASAIERNGDVGDMEYNPPDLGIDYTHLTALRAPRPTLLIYAAEDNYYVGRAPLTKPYLYDKVKPFYRLFGEEDRFEWHENTDPGTHNYELDNRQQSYRFFSKSFGLPVQPQEIPVDKEIKGAEVIQIPLPENNLTILGLARQIADEIEHDVVPNAPEEKQPWAQRKRTRLKEIVRYEPHAVRHAWGVANTRIDGVESRSYRLEFDNGLSASTIWLKKTGTPDGGDVTIVLHDRGRQAAENEIAGLLNRGERVLAIDLVFFGDASPDGPLRPEGSRTNDVVLNQLLDPKSPSVAHWLASRPPTTLYSQLLEALCERALGIEAAQLVGAARWLSEMSPTDRINVVTHGIRSQAAVLVASSLEPELFHAVNIRDGMTSLDHVYDEPVTYQESPELFCRDLYKEFDVEQLKAISEPTEFAAN